MWLNSSLSTWNFHIGYDFFVILCLETLVNVQTCLILIYICNQTILNLSVHYFNDVKVLVYGLRS